ncbi:hypothetical protein F2P79_007812 [Pimephales promelas]|nr:hypothetical protein F2P79_007812 [Pimephales promelas]
MDGWIIFLSHSTPKTLQHPRDSPPQIDDNTNRSSSSRCVGRYPRIHVGIPGFSRCIGSRMLTEMLQLWLSLA